MNSILVMATFVVTMVLIMVNINKFMHIFQQSFYDPRDFFPAISTTKAYKIEIYELILMALGIFSFYSRFALFGYAIFATITAYGTVNLRPIAKKKFVYTARVKITYFVILLLILLTGVTVWYHSSYTYINMVFCVFAIYKSAAICYLIIGNYIAYPILSLINNGYIRSAKKVIKANKNLKVIGITGSYGKTSTKNIINAILEEKYMTVMTPKSYNTTLGVVRTIRKDIKPYTEIFICEMGASKLKDIEKICKIVKPDISVITTIGPQHLTTFKSMDNIIKGKFEIITNAKENVVAVLNADNEYIKKGVEKYAKNTNVIDFSIDNKEAMYYVEDIEMSDKGSIFNIICDDGSKIKIETKLLGKNNIYNIVCSVAIARYLGMTNLEISKAVRKIRPIEHRLELKMMDNILSLDDAFNSNPEGSKAAIETLLMFKDKYKVLVTPGMIELGQKTDELNKQFGKYASKVDYVILVGEVTTKAIIEGLKEENYKNYIVVKDLNEAFLKLKEIQIEHNNLLALFENDLPDSYIK